MLAFVARRFGREAAERAAAPALIGVFAGDAAALSMRSALPRVAAMEREHGSILRALMRRKRGAGMGHPVSFPDGLAELPAALARALGERRRAGRAAEIARYAGGWRVVTPPARRSRASAWCSRRPPRRPRRCSRRTRPRPPPPCARSRTRRWPSSALGFRSAAGLGADLDAYGFVVARGEGVRLLGCQYETSVFPDRAPAGGVLLRALLGGTFDPALVDADDGAIAAAGDRRSAARDRASRATRTSSTSGARAPEFRNTTWRTPTVCARSTTPSRGCRGLAVIGNALRGVGVNDCIAAATRARGRAEVACDAIDVSS